MRHKRKFDMGTTRAAETETPPAAEIDRFVAGEPLPPPEEEPLDRVNFILPRRLRIRFNQEAAARDIKKQDLVWEIFERYFENR